MWCTCVSHLPVSATFIIWSRQGTFSHRWWRAQFMLLHLQRQRWKCLNSSYSGYNLSHNMECKDFKEMEMCGKSCRVFIHVLIVFIFSRLHVRSSSYHLSAGIPVHHGDQRPAVGVGVCGQWHPYSAGHMGKRWAGPAFPQQHTLSA